MNSSEQAAILANEVVEEQLRLSHQVVAQLSGEIRIEERLRLFVLGILEPEPLRREACSERLGAGILQHSFDLLREDLRVGEAAVRGQLQELVVRAHGPQEEREARRQIDVAQPITVARPDVVRFLLEAKYERRTRQDRLQPGPHADLEPLVVGDAIIEGHRAGQILGRDLSAVRLACEARENRFGARAFSAGCGRAAREDLITTGCFREPDSPLGSSDQ